MVGVVVILGKVSEVLVGGARSGDRRCNRRLPSRLLRRAVLASSRRAPPALPPAPFLRAAECRGVEGVTFGGVGMVGVVVILGKVSEVFGCGGSAVGGSKGGEGRGRTLGGGWGLPFFPKYFPQNHHHPHHPHRVF